MEDSHFKAVSQVVWMFSYSFYPVAIVSLMVLAFILANFKKQVPAWMKQLMYPGKLVDKPSSKFSKLINKIEIPKRWFLHFYIHSATFNGFVAVIVFLVYVFHIPAPSWLITALDILMGPERKPTVQEISVIVAACINLIQAIHRIYECLFISVYSKAKMNVLHYLLGIFFYTSLGIALLSHAPGFASKDNAVKALSFSSLQWYHIASICLTIWAIWQQTRANMILADLRKNDRGKVVNMLHSVPYGGWFEMVSSPHFLAEIILYAALLLALEMTYLPYWVIFSFVFVNQTILAIETHKWYKKKFRDYPKNRKAIIPYIF